MEKCTAITKKGEPCNAAAMSGGLCFLHANPARAKQLGQLGGKKNRRFNGVDIQVPEKMNTSDLCDVARQTISAVLSGALQAREATAVAHLISVQSRLLRDVELESRVSKLEQQNAESIQQRQTPTSEHGREDSLQPEGDGGSALGATTEQVTKAAVQLVDESNSSQGTEASESIETGGGRTTGGSTEESTASEAETEADPGSSEVH